jgi:microcystin-dependent protein
MIAFTPHATNGATVTLNVDGLGAKPLRSAPSTELLAGTLIQGTPYIALYNSSDAVFYLRGFYGNPYNIPIAAGMDYWSSIAPNSAFAFPTGQAISRTTYATLFSLLSTTYGVGDGSTTFNLPDKRGRVSAMVETAATLLTSAVSGVDGATYGSKGGAQSRTLVTANLPPYTPAGSVSSSDSSQVLFGGSTSGQVQSGNGVTVPLGSVVLDSVVSSSFTGTAQGGTSPAFPLMT